MIENNTAFRFSFLSIICPEINERPTAGIISARAINPKCKGFLVNWYTNHSITMNCIAKEMVTKNLEKMK